MRGPGAVPDAAIRPLNRAESTRIMSVGCSAAAVGSFSVDDVESVNPSPPPRRADEGRALISAIIPAPAVAVDTREEAVDADLMSGESQAVAEAVPARKQEFTTARMCARQAMAQLKFPPYPIPSGPRGEPQWPPGLVGSITHTKGYRGAVLGLATDFVTIGIDAEPNEPLPDGVLDAISLPRERVWIHEHLASAPEVRWDRLLFCLKEAVYKAWYPLARCWLDFDDALITVDATERTFTARLRVVGPTVHGQKLSSFSGRWLAGHGLLFAAITMREKAQAPLATRPGVPVARAAASGRAGFVARPR